MTFKYLDDFRKKHPISLGSVVGPVLAFAVLGLLMALAYRVGFGGGQAAAIIEENKAPRTLEFVGTISFAILLLRAAIKGPAGIPTGGLGQWFVSGLPALVVSIAASFFGITLGSSLGLLCWEEGMASCSLLSAFSGLGKSAIILGFAYLLALALTIDRSSAPKYSSESFILGYRVICALLVVMLACRSFVVFMIIGSMS